MPRPGPNVTSDADTQPGSDSLFPTGFSGGGALVRSGSVGTGEIADGSVAAADLNLSSVATALAARGEFTATYAQQATSRPVAGRRWCFLGDSITNGSTAGNFYFSYSNLAVHALGSAAARLDYVEAGTTGYTAAKADTFLTTVLATYTDIGGLVVLIGTNDTGTGGPTALAVYQAAVMSIVAKAKAKGLPIVVGTIPPKGGANATSTSRPAVLKANMWLRMWAPTQGCEIAEVYGALADTTTGDLAATYDSGDGTHPNALGHAKIAQVVAQAMNRATVSTRSLISGYSLQTGSSIVANPLMAGTPGAGKPSSWFEQGGGTGTAPTYTIAADTSGLLPAGQWAVMDFDGTASGGTRILATAPAALGGSIGDTMAFTGYILVEDVSGTWEADSVANTCAVNPNLRNQSAVSVVSGNNRLPGFKLGNVFGTGNTVWRIGPMFMPWVIPSGMTGVLLYDTVTVPTGKHIKVYFGCQDIINLTTLGLDTQVGGVEGAVVNLDGP